MLLFLCFFFFFFFVDTILGDTFQHFYWQGNITFVYPKLGRDITAGMETSLAKTLYPSPTIIYGNKLDRHEE